MPILETFEKDISNYTRSFQDFLNNYNRKDVQNLLPGSRDEAFLSLYRKAEGLIKRTLTIAFMIEGADYLLDTNKDTAQRYLLNDFKKAAGVLFQKVESIASDLRIASHAAFQVSAQYANIANGTLAAILNKSYTSLPMHFEKSLYRAIISKPSSDDIYDRIRQEYEGDPDYLILERFHLELARTFMQDLIYLSDPEGLLQISIFDDCKVSGHNVQSVQIRMFAKLSDQNCLIICMWDSARKLYFEIDYMSKLLEGKGEKFKGCLLFSIKEFEDSHYLIRFSNYLPASEITKIIFKGKLNNFSGLNATLEIY
jgi:hypothetical protein